MAHITALQKLLLHRILPGELTGRLDQQLVQIRNGHKPAHEVLDRLGIAVSKLFQLLLDDAGHGLLYSIAQVFFHQRRFCHLGLQIRIILEQIDKLCPFQALHHDPDQAAGDLHQLLDPGDGTDLEQAGGIGILLLDLALGHQEHLLLSHHGVLHGADGLVPADIKMLDHLRKHCQPSERNDRQRHQFFIHEHSPFVYIEKMGRCKTCSLCSSPSLSGDLALTVFL